MPTLTQIDASGITVRTIKVLTQVDTDGTVRVLRELWQNDASNVPRKIFVSLTATASPTNLQTTSGTTNPATCTPVGGTAPYTYSWARTSGDTGWSALFPTSPSTQFTYSGSTDGSTAHFACTVTDATGATTVSNEVIVHMKIIIS